MNTDPDYVLDISRTSSTSPLITCALTSQPRNVPLSFTDGATEWHEHVTDDYRG